MTWGAYNRRACNALVSALQLILTPRAFLSPPSMAMPSVSQCSIPSQRLSNCRGGSGSACFRSNFGSRRRGANLAVAIRFPIACEADLRKVANQSTMGKKQPPFRQNLSARSGNGCQLTSIGSAAWWSLIAMTTRWTMTLGAAGGACAVKTLMREAR